MATIPGIISPYIVAILTENVSFLNDFHFQRIDLLLFFIKEPSNWRIVFFICAAIYIFGMIVFIVFGSTELQSWLRRLSHTSHQTTLTSKSLLIYSTEFHLFFLSEGNEEIDIQINIP